MDRQERNGLGLTKTGVVTAVVVAGCAVILAAGGAYLLRRRWAQNRDEAGAPTPINPADREASCPPDARLGHVRWGDMLLGVAIGALCVCLGCQLVLHTGQNSVSLLYSMRHHRRQRGRRTRVQVQGVD
jgi:uncharacterized protein (DUF2062 family)